MTSLVDHARSEMRHLLEGSEWDRSIAEEVLSLIQKFSDQGHSGGSAPFVVGLFARLAMFKPLGPLTGADDEWNRIEALDGRSFWQNRRKSSVFKDQTGKAWDIDAVVFVDDDNGVEFTCRQSSAMGVVTFPYVVPDRPRVVKVKRKGDGTYELLS